MQPGGSSKVITERVADARSDRPSRGAAAAARRIVAGRSPRTCIAADPSVEHAIRRVGARDGDAAGAERRRHARGRSSVAVELVHLRKEFGDVVAVDDVDLTIGDGEFFSLLGPSGSGKTTVLRMIAGFELPTAGAVLLGGRDVTAPRRRTTATSTRSSRTTRCSRT